MHIRDKMPGQVIFESMKLSNTKKRFKLLRPRTLAYLDKISITAEVKFRHS